MRTSLWRIKEGGRGWGWVDSTVSRFEKTFIRQNCATTLGNAIDFFVSPRFPPLRGVLLACSRARRGAARKEDRICEMAVHEGWISDEVIRGGWSGPPCRGRGKSCKGEKFEVNSIEIGGSTIYFVTGLTSCHPFPFDSMHVRNDSPRCARLFRRETTGWVVFTFLYYHEKFRTYFFFFFCGRYYRKCYRMWFVKKCPIPIKRKKGRLHECRKCYVASSIQGELFLFTRRFLYIVQVSLEGIVYRVFPVKKRIARRRRESVRFVRKVLLSLCILYSVPWYEVSCFYSQIGSCVFVIFLKGA